MSAGEGASPGSDRSLQSFFRREAVWFGLAVVTALAIYRLRDFPYPLDLIGAVQGIAPVLPETAWAAVRVWTFWALSTFAISGLLRRYDPSIEAGDALIAGAAGLWILAYVLGKFRALLQRLAHAQDAAAADLHAGVAHHRQRLPALFPRVGGDDVGEKRAGRLQVVVVAVHTHLGELPPPARR